MVREGFLTTKPVIILLFALAGLLISTLVHADDPSKQLPKQQTVYVPVYSHIYAGDHENPVYLAATLSIHNTDLKNTITITKADYYDTQGKLIKSYIDQPVSLKAISSLRYVIKESDKVGGSGANFIVQWMCDKPVNPPLIESVMISTRSALGIAFTSRGQVLH